MLRVVDFRLYGSDPRTLGGPKNHFGLPAR
jgi:hypothetical protein